MRSVPVRALILGVALVTGCKPEPFRPDAAERPPDAPPPEWWQPRPTEAIDWDIQLSETMFDVSAARGMYTIELFDAVPSMQTLDYGDGMPVTVPAGVHAMAMARLKAMTPAPIVVCHVGTGAIRLDDPDAMKFPGWKTNPPDMPQMPESGSVIGWSTPFGTPKERFIDITESAMRGKVVSLIDKRLELAKKIGCDAVVTQWDDQSAYQGAPGTGFMALKVEEFLSWSSALTGKAHERKLSIGMRSTAVTAVENTHPYYDWLLFERCAERGDLECNNATKEYAGVQKAAFALEYKRNEDDTADNNITTLCMRLGAAGLKSRSIFKTTALDTVREPCP
ncbi:MAG TPA: endo alpha-1,4 polygalactosaminidase [Kofleriaceae bacterium]|nr:endo alpha-1,4 polygalactosaminidase [Kofleriaceae bacterium]